MTQISFTQSANNYFRMDRKPRKKRDILCDQYDVIMLHYLVCVVFSVGTFPLLQNHGAVAVYKE